jgi:hypothetical protein
VRSRSRRTRCPRQPAGERLVKISKHFREIHACLFKHRPVLQNSGAAASALIAHPEVFAKSPAAVELLERVAYLVLKSGEKVSRSISEHMLRVHAPRSFPFECPTNFSLSPEPAYVDKTEVFRIIKNEDTATFFRCLGK